LGSVADPRCELIFSYKGKKEGLEVFDID
jgi:hypothetical protein